MIAFLVKSGSDPHIMVLCRERGTGMTSPFKLTGMFSPQGPQNDPNLLAFALEIHILGPKISPNFACGATSKFLPRSEATAEVEGGYKLKGGIYSRDYTDV